MLMIRFDDVLVILVYVSIKLEDKLYLMRKGAFCIIGLSKYKISLGTFTFSALIIICTLRSYYLRKNYLFAETTYYETGCFVVQVGIFYPEVM